MMRLFARAARPAAASVRPRVLPAFAAPSTVQHARTYVTATKYSRNEVVETLDKFHAEVLSANWADYLYLVYNGPFWEAEYAKLNAIVQPYTHEDSVGSKFAEVQEMMDVLYACEDVRDHLNELAELVTRASGFMGTGWQAGEKVENMQEHAEHCAAEYDRLIAAHPSFKPKIEQSVGHGLAILRSKHKFRAANLHRYFY